MPWLDPANPPLQNKKLKRSKFETARRSLVHDYDKPRLGIDWYYQPIEIGDVIAKLGWWNPLHGGRPKMFVQKLLDGIPSPCPGKGFDWKGVGLMYFTPCVVGRARSKNRTSVAGLALLKHWSACHPKFRPFFDAYYSSEAEVRITLDCVDFALNVMPSRFKAVIENNKEMLKEKNEKNLQDLAQRQRQSSLNQAQQAMQSNMVAQQAMQQASMRTQRAIQNASGLFGKGALGGLLGGRYGNQ